MPILPLIEWAPELIDRRLQFLESAARFVPPAAGDETPTPSERGPGRDGPITDIHAMMMAADLALATNRTQRGLDILRSAVGALTARRDLQAAALPGSVIGRVVTTIHQAGFEIVDQGGEPRGFEEARAPSPTSIALRTDLLIASLVSDVPSDRVYGFSDDWPGPVLGSGEPLLHALAAFGRPDAWPTAQEGLVANTVAWLERLGRMRLDREHWKAARVRGALLDMRRLMFEIALLRRQDGAEFLVWRGEPAGDSLTAGIERFVRKLATEIAEADVSLR